MYIVTLTYRHKLFASLVFLYGSLAANGAQQPVSNEVQSLTETARAAEQGHDYLKAADAYKQLTHLVAPGGELYSNLGLAYHMAGKFENARQAFEKALALNNQLTVPKLFLGIEYQLLSHPDKSIPYLVQASNERPNDPFPHKRLAQSYMETGDYSKAVAQLRATRSLQRGKEDPELWFLFGENYLKLSGLKSADLFGGATNSPYVNLIRAQKYLSSGDSLLALAQYRMALERKPDLEGVHLKIAKLLFDTRDFDKALVECQQELELDPDSPHANLLMARLLERLGRRPEMAPYLKKLSSLRSTDDPELRSLPAGAAQILSSPDQPEVVCSSLAQCAQVARTLEKDKRYEDCRNVWESARGFGPLRPSMLSSLARVLYLTGHFTEVVSTLTPLQHGNQFSDEDRMLLGKSLLRLGDAERASQVLTAIKSSSNSYYEALYLEADCFGSMARSAFEELAMVAPNSYWTHVVMAESLALQGQTKKAIGEYFEALKLRPDAPALHLKIGNLYWKVLDDDNAVSQFLAEVSTYPFSAVANYALGHAYLEIHQLEDAVAYLRKATELDGSLTDAHRDLGKLYLLKKEPEKAVLELETAVRQDANDKAAHYHLYRAYAMLGSPAKAQAELAVFKRLEAGGTQKTLDSVERNEDRSPSPDIQR